MLKANVITITRLKDRKEQFIKSWENTNLQYELHEGLDYQTIANIVPKNRYFQRALPQVCIAYSHFDILEKFYETRDEYCLIMEDDAVPTQHWATLDWNRIFNFQFNILKLYSMVLDKSWVGNTSIHKPKPVDDYFIDLTGLPLSTTAYIVTRRVVERILKYGFHDFKIEYLLEEKGPDTYGLVNQPVHHNSNSSYIHYQVGERPWRLFNPGCN